MGWFAEYCKENLRRSFGLWERHEAMSILIGLFVAATLAALSLLGIGQVREFPWATNLAIGLGVWFLLVVLVVTPVKMWKEHTDTISRLTNKRLIVPQAEVYDDGIGCHWLRLRVENPTALPIQDCYGKLLSYRLLNYPLIHEGEFIRQPVSPERGYQRSKTAQLPPDKHPFPWQPIQLPPVTITIPGHHSYEFLYAVSKREGSTSFGTPTDMGVRYDNWGVGDYELELVIGSESEAFQATKVRVVFRVTASELQFVSLDTIK